MCLAQTMNDNSLSPEHFLKVATFVEEKFGIKMPPSKKTMVLSRLLKRMKHRGFSSVNTYIDYVFSPEGRRNELTNLVDCVTTNKTDFFREPGHFKTLCDKIMPALFDENYVSANKSVRVWSSACSSGEEPYTIAMCLSEFAEHKPGIRFSILASDISTRVLKKAHSGIYDEERIKDVPMMMRQKYLLKSRDRDMGLVQIKSSIRDKITFKLINLIDDDFGISEKMHIIFCRNVLIYFDCKAQEALMHRFAKQLVPGGFLIIGHSETLSGMNVPFTQLMPTLYRKNG